MRNLISNKTNIPLTKNEAVKVVAAAITFSVVGLALSFTSLKNLCVEKVDFEPYYPNLPKV